MGEVYRATDMTLGRQVAIKVLPEAFAQDAERLARFEREARSLAALSLRWKRRRRDRADHARRELDGGPGEVGQAVTTEDWMPWTRQRCRG